MYYSALSKVISSKKTHYSVSEILNSISKGDIVVTHNIPENCHDICKAIYFGIDPSHHYVHIGHTLFMKIICNIIK